MWHSMLLDKLKIDRNLEKLLAKKCQQAESKTVTEDGDY